MDGRTEITRRPSEAMHPRALSMLQAFEEIEPAPSHTMICKYASVIHAPVELVKDWFYNQRLQSRPAGKAEGLNAGIQAHARQVDAACFVSINSSPIDDAVFVPPSSSTSWRMATRSPCPTESSVSSSPKSSLTASLDSDDGAIQREIAVDAVSEWSAASRAPPTEPLRASSHAGSALEQDAIMALQHLAAGDFCTASTSLYEAPFHPRLSTPIAGY